MAEASLALAAEVSSTNKNEYSSLIQILFMHSFLWSNPLICIIVTKMLLSGWVVIPHSLSYLMYVYMGSNSILGLE